MDAADGVAIQLHTLQHGSIDLMVQFHPRKACAPRGFHKIRKDREVLLMPHRGAGGVVDHLRLRRACRPRENLKQFTKILDVLVRRHPRVLSLLFLERR